MACLHVTSRSALCDASALDQGGSIIGTMVSGAAESGLADGAAEQMAGAVGSMLTQGATQAATARRRLQASSDVDGASSNGTNNSN